MSFRGVVSFNESQKLLINNRIIILVSQLKKEIVPTLYFFIFLYTISIYFVQFEVSSN